MYLDPNINGTSDPVHQLTPPGGLRVPRVPRSSSPGSSGHHGALRRFGCKGDSPRGPPYMVLSGVFTGLPRDPKHRTVEAMHVDTPERRV